MLAPVTRLNSGRVPACDQPARTPAANAPSAPPPDIASHGPLADGSTRMKSALESPQTRASGIEGIFATASSSAVNAARGGNCLALGASLPLPVSAFGLSFGP